MTHYRFWIHISNYRFHTDWYKIIFHKQRPQTIDQEAIAIQNSIAAMMQSEFTNYVMVTVEYN